jgi:hypothetical protein
MYAQYQKAAVLLVSRTHLKLSGKLLDVTVTAGNCWFTNGYFVADVCRQDGSCCAVGSHCMVGCN